MLAKSERTKALERKLDIAQRVFDCMMEDDEGSYILGDNLWCEFDAAFNRGRL